MTDRVSNEYIAAELAAMEIEDARASWNGEAHGNYGEDFRAALEDLRDCRAERDEFKALWNNDDESLAEIDKALESESSVIADNHESHAEAVARIIVERDALRAELVDITACDELNLPCACVDIAATALAATERK